MLILSRNSELNGPQYLDQSINGSIEGPVVTHPMCPGDAVTSREWRHEATSQGLSYAVYSLTHDAYKCFKFEVLTFQPSKSDRQLVTAIAVEKVAFQL